MPTYSDGKEIKPGHVVQYNNELYVVLDKKDRHGDYYIKNLVEHWECSPDSIELTFVAERRTIDYLMVGDYILDGYLHKKKVLGRAGEVFFTSWASDNSEDFDKKAGGCSTIYQLKEYGYTLLHEDEDKDEQDDTIEMTLKEVAELKGVPVEKLRIKDED